MATCGIYHILFLLDTVTFITPLNNTTTRSMAMAAVTFELACATPLILHYIAIVTAN